MGTLQTVLSGLHPDHRPDAIVRTPLPWFLETDPVRVGRAILRSDPCPSPQMGADGPRPIGRRVCPHMDGIAWITPFVHDTLIGFTHTIEARNQTSGVGSYTFSSWSDGGAQQHTIMVPS